MMAIANRIGRGCALVGIAAVWGHTPGAAAPPESASRRADAASREERLLASDPRYGDGAYVLRNRNDLWAAGPSRDVLRRIDRYQLSDRGALPLNRSGVYRSWPPNHYRRVTPYYDGRGYGVRSTSPYRYRQDLDSRIRSWRRR